MPTRRPQQRVVRPNKKEKSVVRANGNHAVAHTRTTRQVGNIDVESELLVQQLELLVRGRGVHEVVARADVGAILLRGDELEVERVAIHGDACGVVVAGRDSVTGLMLAAAMTPRDGTTVAQYKYLHTPDHPRVKCPDITNQSSNTWRENGP